MAFLAFILLPLRRPPSKAGTQRHTSKHAAITVKDGAIHTAKNCLTASPKLAVIVWGQPFARRAPPIYVIWFKSHARAKAQSRLTVATEMPMV